MKAVIWSKYGGPELLEIGEIDRPVPQDKEVLVKIHAATVTAGDCELRRFDIAGWIWLPVRLFMGIQKPRIKVLGQELSGEIVGKGSAVSTFNVGDAIFASAGMSMGGYAEYTCLNTKSAISLKPEQISYEAAATIPTGGINALHFLRKGKVGQGDKILINGAGGSIGTYAVQIAKLWGAEVTCVDSALKLEMLTNIGADHVINYEKQDFTSNGQTYDVIIDIAGHISYSRALKSLNKNGRLVLGNPHFLGMIRSFWTSWFTSKKVFFALASESNEDYDYLKTLIVDKKLSPVIDRHYPLEQVPEAHQYVESGLKKGNVIINII